MNAYASDNENQHRRKIRVSPGGTGHVLKEVPPDPDETEEIEQEKRQREREEELRREQKTDEHQRDN